MAIGLRNIAGPFLQLSLSFAKIVFSYQFACAVKSVLDLPEGQDVVVIGTLYKDMKLKPSILAEYSKVSSAGTF